MYKRLEKAAGEDAEVGDPLPEVLYIAVLKGLFVLQKDVDLRKGH